MVGIYTIPSGYSFLESLSIGFLRLGAKDPFVLSQMEVFLPTRRACIEVQRAMVRRETERCFLLPKLIPLGDLDEDEIALTSPLDEDELPPLLAPFDRLSLLTKLIEEYTVKSGVPSTPALSLKLAKSLVSLMDQATIENVPWEGLLRLVPSEFAGHWQLTLDFLEIITAHWPKILEEQGVVEPHTRHHQLVQKMIARWEQSPPSHPIIAAGSTGTMPATCQLLQAIAHLPQGMVILPGLDSTLLEEEVADLSPCHPQYAPVQFLQKMNLLPSDVQLWEGLEGQQVACPERVQLFAQSLKPSFTTEGTSPEKALEGVHRVLCASPQEEALAIAVLMRQQLEMPEQRIALITSDLKLTERVREELKRWGIEVDSSAGEPLNQTPPGVFLSLCIEYAANPDDQVAMLSLLKHPLFRLTSKRDVRRFERKVLREKAPAVGVKKRSSSRNLENLANEMSLDFLNIRDPGPLNANQEFISGSRMPRKAKSHFVCSSFSRLRDDDIGGTLHSLFHPLTTLEKAPFDQLLSLHISIAEALALDLWKGATGEAVKTFVEELKKTASKISPVRPFHPSFDFGPSGTYAQDEWNESNAARPERRHEVPESKDEQGSVFPNLTLTEYAAVFKEFMIGQKLRFRPQRHLRLAILGTIEARLFHADVMILGGLNEGTWPPDISLDPWLNRPMRKEMGFPSPERRIGLSAHDFGQAFASPKVYLTRSLKVDGTPTIACRWLERLDIYLKSWNLAFLEEPRVLEWGRYLDQPEVYTTQSPPMPCPPVGVRPRRLSVTQIETWMRDPYALYARHILGLSPLDPLNEEVGPADRGTLLHKIFEEFFKICGDPHHKDSLEILLSIGKTLFEPYEVHPNVRLFWWPRFESIAKWFITHERVTRLPGTHTFTEVKGQLTFTTPQGPFTCTAKADRIDLLPDGRLRILDYKTGMPPSEQDVTLGFSPQLPLEGAIALAQGFEGIPEGSLESLQFWWLKGEGGVVKTLSGDPEERSLKALEGLKRMVLLFEDEMIPYPARPLPGKGLKCNDYEQLARLQEWGRI